jgi:phenylpropionate dioxygenase-like ring-hydroxylating dioxygenase large terminal subunit
MTVKNKLLSAEEIAAVGDSIERAKTLPPRVYTDPAVYGQESERLFRGGWLCAGRIDQIPNPGDYVTLDLLDEPLMVVRDKDDSVRVLSRVCRHRSSDLLPSSEPVERGNTTTFKCPYHAWTYGLDGRLMGAPMMQRSEVLDKENCRLSEIRSDA